MHKNGSTVQNSRRHKRSVAGSRVYVTEELRGIKTQLV
jgi:hypothetical protein